MNLNTTEIAVKTVLNDHTNESNAFRLKDMKKVYETVKKGTAESHGLDPDSIDCTVSDRTAKV